MLSNHPFEQARLQALANLAILDSPAEQEYNDLVELAARICEVPISLVSLVADDRQWFKARTGLAMPETPRSLSFCDHALRQNDIFVVKDAAQDPRFADNALVTGEPFIRFYAGAPIASADGHKLGTLCILDRQPRELTWAQASALKTLAVQVSQLLALRQANETVRQLTEAAEERTQAMTRLRNQKSRKTELSQSALQNVAAFLRQELQMLKTGKFTKKELTGLAQRADALGTKLQLLNDGLAVLARLRSGDYQPVSESLCLTGLLQSLQTQGADTLKGAAVRLQTFLPASLPLRQPHEPLALLFDLLLQTVVSLLHKTELVLEASERPGFVEVRFTVHGCDLRQRLSPSSTDAVHTKEESQLAMLLAGELVTELGGELLVSRLGDSGTAVTVHLPPSP